MNEEIKFALLDTLAESSANLENENSDSTKNLTAGIRKIQKALKPQE